MVYQHVGLEFEIEMCYVFGICGGSTIVVSDCLGLDGSGIEVVIVSNKISCFSLDCRWFQNVWI